MKLRTLLLCAVVGIVSSLLTAQGQVPGVNSTLQSVFTLAYDNSTMKQTFSASTSLTPVAGAGDVCSLSGSATKTVKVRRIIFAGIHTTAQSDPVTILKRSTAYTAGAGAAINKVAYDSANTASSVNMAEAWTALPTAGTLTGVLVDVPVFFPLLASVAQPTYTFTFGALGQPIVLRGIAQQVAVNLNNLTFGGPIYCTFEWTEE